ncbi:MAG TPA: DOMON-like domain-containing protein [Candidatus Binatia bacterium]|nr:DOMON-like domain-containing protein [Candidatus Binatia bacterium]
METEARGVPLVPHTKNREDAALAIETRALRTEAAIAFTYTLRGDLARLRIPPPLKPVRTDELWRHTCFEAFVSPAGARAYYEFNFAPSCEWAMYCFRDYRDRAPLELEYVSAPRITVRRGTDLLQLDAIVEVHALALLDPAQPLKIGLAAVLEDETGAVGYWALRHPLGKPDFHHADNFALELARANGAGT